MGQAKQRGTFEERKKQAIARNNAPVDIKFSSATKVESQPFTPKRKEYGKRSSIMAAALLLATMPPFNNK